MGWKKRKVDQRGTANQKGVSGWGTKYDSVVMENAIFEGYYKAQKIVPEDEWASFISHLKEPLPATFRITPYRSQAKTVLKIIQGEYFKDLTEEAMQPTCLPWYPENLAWQLKLSKRDIRKSEANVKLHNFLVSETDAGSISRQETVSMIPPIALDVQPHHKVLDMCAAPGSKTTQLVEMLHTRQDEGQIPEGVVVANDANNKRCYMMVHQLKRLQSPCVLITNHDASSMPNIRLPGAGGGEAVLKFDRILCDVPCTGDGTMRKNLDIWAKWNTANGNNLHGLQFRIARRGLEMLAVNGQLVYSTCSLNPVEDEAVIHRLLVETKGAVQVVDVSHRLPGLKYCQGLKHWVITDRDLTVYENPDAVPEAKRHLIRASIFPPNPEDADKFHLERCIRVLPHQQNTGGFFVAVLQKISLLPWESVTKAQASETSQAALQTEAEGEQVMVVEQASGTRSPLRKKRRGNVFKEDPFIFFEKDEPLWPPIKEFFGIDETLDPSLLLTRNKDGRKRNIYVVNRLIRDITRINEGHIQIINTGVKMFSRSDNRTSECDFRMTEEGASILMKHMTKKRRVVINRNDLEILLMNDLSELAPEMSRFSPATVEQLKPLATGSCLLEYKDDLLSIVLVGWKGDHSARAFVPKNDRVHHLRLIGGDFSKFVVNKFDEKQKAAEAKAAEAAEAAEAATHVKQEVAETAEAASHVKQEVAEAATHVKQEVAEAATHVKQEVAEAATHVKQEVAEAATHVKQESDSADSNEKK